MPRVPTTVQPIQAKDDVRVTHEYATLNGRRYHYVNGLPTNQEQKGVALLLHGFPDFWWGWRYTIPSLLDQGLRVIVPDLLGYGETDKPECPPEDIAAYSLKNTADALAELLKQLDIPKVTVIGHDWGSFAAQRFAFFHPELVSHIAVIAVPITGPTTQYIPLEVLVKVVPSLRYQLCFADPEKVEKRLTTREAVESFLNGLYLPKPETKQPPNTLPYISRGDDVLELIGNPPKSDLLSEAEHQHIIDVFFKGGFHGPCNWYRTRLDAYNDEKDMTLKQLPMPALFIRATHDIIITDQMAAGQSKVAPDLTIREVDTGHWAMIEDPDAVNVVLAEWFAAVVFGDKAKL